MPAVPFDSKNLNINAGTLYHAPLGSTKPTDLATAWAAAWIKVGGTKSGSTFKYELKTTGLYIAEFLDRVTTITTERNIMIGFDAAEETLATWKLAMNGGTVTTAVGGVVTIKPPLANAAPVKKMIGWESADATVRLIVDQAMQTEAWEIKHDKSQYSSFPLMFIAEQIDETTEPFTVILAAARG